MLTAALAAVMVILIRKSRFICSSEKETAPVE